jgi:hypothetical protein
MVGELQHELLPHHPGRPEDPHVNPALHLFSLPVQSKKNPPGG